MKFELLGKLRDEEESGSSSSTTGGDLPIDEVTRLSEQGYSETEIIEQLRDRGYSYGDINEALNAAVKESASRQSGMGGGQGNNMTQGNQGQGYGSEQSNGNQGNFNQQGGQSGGGEWEPMQSQSFNEPQQQRDPEPAPAPRGGYDDEYYEDDDWAGAGITPEEEELIEIIVSEHMTDVEGEMNQFRSELEQLRNDFQELRQSFNEIDIRNDEDEKVVIQKVNEMEEYFEQTSSRMGGMEKALQQVLPSLVENVRDLSSIVREMKEERR